MICELPGCGKPRTPRAKFCGNTCRKLAFQKRHDHIGVPITAKTIKQKPQADDFDLFREASLKSTKAACGHIIRTGGRCLQKGCYGVLKKAKK